MVRFAHERVNDFVMILKWVSSRAALFWVIVAVFLFASLSLVPGFALQDASLSESQMYVHTYLNSTSLGNWTYVEKPMFPVFFNTSQIPIGQNWTVVCPLVANHSYHVYLYGAWINTTAAAKTDYNVYVYDPQGQLESTHTEAAGFPEHLGTTVNDALFVPAYSGKYTWVIVNSAGQSHGAQQATFMIIENLATDVWQTHFSEGKDSNGQEGFNTCWAYEFVTNASHMELWIKVPNTLDMYEARLYLMSNLNSSSLNGSPLPWEPGLYGNRSSIVSSTKGSVASASNSSVGGYNFDAEGYRGVAYASCEYSGEDMYLNFTSPYPGPNLYQLVFIGEFGSGNLEFLFKTRFNDTILSPLTFPRRVYPGNATEIAYASNSTDLNEAVLKYTTDNWTSSTSVEMAVSDETCNSTIPPQQAGTLVQYKVQASDIMENNFTTAGNFTVKQPVTLNITALDDKIRLGENATFEGVLTPSNASLPVEVQFIIGNLTENVECLTAVNGSFVASFQPNATGVWDVQAKFFETGTAYGGVSPDLLLTVEEQPFYVKYSIFLVGGIAGAATVGAVVYFLKFRNRSN